jgi:branched-chain amino acid transport system ATP-binding protein
MLQVEAIDTYYGNSHVLHDVSLEVPSGSVVVLLGRNGAGKTTLMRSIMGVTPPRSGAILFDDVDITGVAPHVINSHGLSIVPEDRRVFPTLTVHENLRLARKLARNPLDIDDVYAMFPALGPLRSNLGQNLSGGEQQMVSVARALVQNPDMLLLDEPTEGLAPVIVEDLVGIIETVIEQDVTVLMTEQNVAFALGLADGVLLMDTGSIVFDGETSELRERPELLKRYLSVGDGDAG